MRAAIGDNYKPSFQNWLRHTTRMVMPRFHRCFTMPVRASSLIKFSNQTKTLTKSKKRKAMNHLLDKAWKHLDSFSFRLCSMPRNWPSRKTENACYERSKVLQSRSWQTRSSSRSQWKSLLPLHSFWSSACSIDRLLWPTQQPSVTHRWPTGCWLSSLDSLSSPSYASFASQSWEVWPIRSTLTIRYWSQPVRSSSSLYGLSMATPSSLAPCVSQKRHVWLLTVTPLSKSNLNSTHRLCWALWAWSCWSIGSYSSQWSSWYCSH